MRYLNKEVNFNLSGGFMKLGIDIGFNSVKVAGPGGIEIKFPTAVAVYNKPQIEIGTSKKRPSFYNGKFYLIGEDAIGEAGIKYSLEIDFLIEYAPLFIHKAIEKAERLTGETVDSISLGLPIAYYRPRMFDLWRKVEGFVVDGRVYKFHSEINGEKIRAVHPQGGGILIDYIVKNNVDMAGAKDKGFVLDIGFNTVIVIAFGEKYTGVPENSKQYSQLGISRVINDLEQKIAINYGIDDKTKIEVAQILIAKQVKNYGKIINLESMINEVVENYIDNIMLRIQSDYEKKFREIDKLIIAGGGAYYIKNSSRLFEKYKDIIVVIERPEFSNARGFYYI